MLRRILTCALLGGLGTGAVLFGLHAVLTVPLILQAEVYEAKARPGSSETADQRDASLDDEAHSHADQAHAVDRAESWSPNGLERSALTLLATLVSTIGFALMLVSAAVLARGDITIGSGVAFGLAGFAATGLATGLGLAPELPGSAAPDLVLRQAWWLGTATATGIGLAAIVFSPRTIFKGLGLLLIVAPHVIGAPGGGIAGSPVPAELSALFAARSLALQGLMWALLGAACGWIWQRQEGRTRPAAAVT